MPYKSPFRCNVGMPKGGMSRGCTQTFLGISNDTTMLSNAKKVCNKIVFRNPDFSEMPQGTTVVIKNN